MTLNLHYETADVVLYAGDCLDVLRSDQLGYDYRLGYSAPLLPDNSVDSIVTDPPSGIGFMQKSWDSDRGGREQWSAWLADVMREAYRVAKPGAHALVWALPRTSHWTACGIEDAGWVIRDRVHHLFGSGFPKSSRVDRDERYCQCGATGRTSSHTSPEPLHGDHTRMAADEEPAEHAGRSAPSATRAALGSPGGCLPAGGSGGALPPRVPVIDLASPPSLGDVLGRSRSLVPVDGQGDGSSRSPCPAPRTDHPASPGSQGPASFETSPGTGIPVSSTAGPRTGSGSGSRRHHSPHTVSSPSAWGQCIKCGKPMTKGLGTALKPSAEDWWLARKPLSEGTVAANVLRWGCGALNIDGTRVNPGEQIGGGGGFAAHKVATTQGWDRPYVNGVGKTEGHAQGRWPAHTLITHDARCGERCLAECPAAVMDGQSGESTTPTSVTRGGNRSEAYGMGRQEGVACFGDSGGASRFFPQFRWSPGDDSAPWLYTAKAASAERPRAKRDGAGEGRVIAGTIKRCPECGCQTIRSGAGGAPACGHGKWEHVPVEKRADHVAHPTVKPLELMRWLVRLTTPPGGVVLDCFAGSGTTGEAALQEGMRAVLIEREPDYLPLIVQRLTRQRDPVAYAQATGTEGEALW